MEEIREAKYWLRIVEHCSLAPSESVQPLLAEANELTAILTAGMRKLHPILVLVVLLVTIAFTAASFSFQF